MTSFFNVLPEPYPDISLFDKEVEIDSNTYTQRLSEILRTIGYISNFAIDGARIKIVTRKS
jgi:hypothetical protein